LRVKATSFSTNEQFTTSLLRRTEFACVIYTTFLYFNLIYVLVYIAIIVPQRNLLFTSLLLAIYLFIYLVITFVTNFLLFKQKQKKLYFLNLNAGYK
jgi:uncharacterized membrane protein